MPNSLTYTNVRKQNIKSFISRICVIIVSIFVTFCASDFTCSWQHINGTISHSHRFMIIRKIVLCRNSCQVVESSKTILYHFLLHGPPMMVDNTNFGLVLYNHAKFCRFEESSSYWSVKRISVFLYFSLVNQRHTSGITVCKQTVTNIENTVRAVHCCNSWF